MLSLRLEAYVVYLVSNCVVYYELLELNETIAGDR